MLFPQPQRREPPTSREAPPRGRTALRAKWMWRWGLRLVLGVAAVALAVGAYDRLFTLGWDGRTDLEVEFRVVDADSGEPVGGAEVAVECYGGSYADEDMKRDAGGFLLRTDAGGSATRLCRSTWVGGELSGLGFTSRRFVTRPVWRYRVSAPGYLTTEPNLLPHDETRRVRPGGDRLEVSVQLQRWA